MQSDDTERTVELDTTAIDSADLANIGTLELADAVIEIAGVPDQAGVLPEKVRISGTVTIELADKQSVHADADQDEDDDREVRADGGTSSSGTDHSTQTTAPSKIHDDDEQAEAALTEIEYFLSRADVPPNLSTLDPNLRRARDHLRDVVRSQEADTCRSGGDER